MAQTGDVLRRDGAVLLALGLLVVACAASEDNSAEATGAATSGAGGDNAGATTTGTPATTGATSAATTSGTGGEPGTSATSGTGGAATTGTTGAGGATPPDDGSIGTGGSNGTGGSSRDASAGDSGDLFEWYEAEAVPPNVLGGGSKIVSCGTAPACASIASIMEGVECCSGGKKVGNILGRRGGYLELQGIGAPADGMYDVTWWYHCGKSDNFGDADCGGQPHTPAGCRPHRLIVNGVQLPQVYHFPCFAGSWGEIHASTTSLPLKAGATNVIRIWPPNPRDAADIDAIAVVPPGRGTPPRITPTDR